MRTSHGKLRALILVVSAVLLLVGLPTSVSLAGTSSSTGGSARPVYNAIPSKVSGNVPSEGFECCQTKEFGDEVGLGGTPRTLASMSVLFSSWGCESGHWYSGDCVTTPGATFSVPLTFTIYEDNSGIRGDVLARQTQIVDILYRPSASPECTGGRWYNSKDRMCYNGLPQTITMDFSDGTTLPSQVIWSVAFNTTTGGYMPVGPSTCNLSPGGCGYDSLNVGTYSFPSAPFVGSDINEDEAFWNGVMQPGWTGYRPLGAIAAKG
jgi:hypothetical protein